jgi:hypothetical protein
LLLGSETTTKLKLLQNSFKISFHFAFKVSIKKQSVIYGIQASKLIIKILKTQKKEEEEEEEEEALRT